MNLQSHLKIISINVNSIININRRIELSKFLTDNNPDIVLLNETKLNAKHKLKFNGYNLIRRDRSSRTTGGGTAILIRENMKFAKVFNYRVDSLSYLEACIIKMHMPPNNIMYLIAAYYPSRNNNDAFKSELNVIFEALDLQNPDHYYILAGDLNSKHSDWGNTQNNTKSNALKDWLTSNAIEFRCNMYASVTPSYERTHSFLDICIADHRIDIQKVNDTINCLKCIDYDSDHCAIEINATRKDGTFFLNLAGNPIQRTLDYKKTNWKKFRNTLKTQLQKENLTPNNRNLTNSEIDLHLLKLNKIILAAVEKKRTKS